MCKGKLKCWYTNASSLSNKLDEFHACIDKEQPHIVAVTEIWMKDELVLNGYHQALRHDRQETVKGGGVVLFVKDSLKIVDCQEVSGLPFDESVWCLIKLTRSELMLLGVCYRSPNSTLENNEQLISVFKRTKQLHVQHVLVIGDFNYPQIDWNKGKVEGPDDSSQVQFYDTVQDLFWVQHVDFPTRFRIGQTPSQLDLVFTKHEYAVDQIEARAPLGKSDHVVLTWDYQFQPESIGITQTQHKAHRYDFKKGRYGDMAKELQGVDWGLNDDMSVDMMWNRIKEVLNSCFEHHIPLQRIQKE